MDEARLRERLRKVFTRELHQEVEVFLDSIAGLREGRPQADRAALIERAFRAAHSLKGAARSARYPAIEELCRRLDAALRPWREAEDAPDAQLLDRLLRAGEVLRDTARRLAEGEEPDPVALAGAFPGDTTAGAAPTSAAAGPSPAGADSATLLLAEDSETVRRLARTLLEEAGYAVVEAEDGTAALEIARRQRVDLVLADVDMPGLDGFELTRALRAEPSTASVPVVLLSGILSPAEEERSRACGASAFLLKSGFDFGEVLNEVARLLGEARGG